MDFSKLNGLVPAVIQDDGTNDVWRAGSKTEPAVARTRETGFVTFYSRTKARLWTKGETSGNRLRVLSIRADCDEDTLLIRVAREGDGRVCHLGTITCFDRKEASCL